MSSLSIVVPRLGADLLFENTLGSILRYRMPHHQVIVVQSDLQADTYGLEGEVQFVEVAGKPKINAPRLNAYLNQGLKVARGDVINVIRPGIEVTHQWFAHGVRYLSHAEIGSAATSIAAANDRNEIVSCGLLTDLTMLPRHATDSIQRPFAASMWAAFYRREVLQLIGELDESISDEFCGLDMGLSLARLGLKCAVVTDRVLTIQSEKMLKLVPRQQAGRDAQRMVQRHAIGQRQTWDSVVAIATDGLKSFWRPARWAQVAGRFSAGSKQATDRAFVRALALAGHDLARLQSEAVDPNRTRKAA